MRFKVLSAFLPLFLLAACGKDSNTSLPPEVKADRGLLLTTTQNYESSRLFFFEFATGNVTQLLSGESGDPSLFLSRDQIFFFNRSATNSNMRRITIQEGSFNIGVQTSIPGAGAGDPQAIIHLDERHLLMSFWASSSLGIFDLQEGKMTTAPAISFDTGAAINPSHIFRPSPLFTAEKNGVTEFYVIHQGLASDGLSLTGKQQIFIMTWNGTQLSAIDLDESKEGVQGIAIKVTNPTDVFQLSNGQVLISGSCTIYGGANCISGFESVDLNTRTTSLVWDMSSMKEKHNGALIKGDDQTFFAQMITPDLTDPLKGEKIIARLELTNKTVQTLYTYPENSIGCCSLFIDNTRPKLIAPDFTPEGGGSINVIDTGIGSAQSSESFAVPNAPYNGLVIQ